MLLVDLRSEIFSCNKRPQLGEKQGTGRPIEQSRFSVYELRFIAYTRYTRVCMYRTRVSRRLNVSLT